MKPKKEYISEEDLISQLINRDKKAIEYLYDNYCSAIYGVILKILKSEELSEEVLQDCFLKFWTRINEYDSSKGRLFTWMINITRNLTIDKLRSKDFRSMSRNEDILSATAHMDKDYFLKYKPEHTGLDDILEKLNPDQKVLLDLMYFEGYSQTEIAEKLNIPLGTVKTRVRTAMTTLRKFLNKN